MRSQLGNHVLQILLSRYSSVVMIALLCEPFHSLIQLITSFFRLKVSKSMLPASGVAMAYLLAIRE